MTNTTTELPVQAASRTAEPPMAAVDYAAVQAAFDAEGHLYPADMGPIFGWAS